MKLPNAPVSKHPHVKYSLLAGGDLPFFWTVIIAEREGEKAERKLREGICFFHFFFFLHNAYVNSHQGFHLSAVAKPFGGDDFVWQSTMVYSHTFFFFYERSIKKNSHQALEEGKFKKQTKFAIQEEHVIVYKFIYSVYVPVPVCRYEI